MGSDVNYKPLIFEKLQDFVIACPSYSIGDIVHSVITQLSKKDLALGTKGDILNITDKEFYTCLCKAYKDESINDEPII
jgi:hypothetical protein